MNQAGTGSARVRQSGSVLDLTAEARELLSGLINEPWGQVSDSIYETGRLASLAPWLSGHSERLAYLLRNQRADGGWGGPGGYALVPSLSATEALLTVQAGRTGEPPPGRTGSAAALERPLARATERGLCFLSRLLTAVDASTLPDMPAIDVICHSLIESINRALARTAVRTHQRTSGTAGSALKSDWGAPAAHGRRWATRRDGLPLQAPAGLDGKRLALIRAAVGTGADVPAKLLHALEVVGEGMRGHPSVGPGPLGVLGASPAATAAWLDVDRSADPGLPGHAARRFLEALTSRRNGPVPCGLPITVFERAWVLTTLARAGLVTDVPDELVESLREALKPEGAAAGEGLPADADTTSAALYALGLLGEPCPPGGLWAFDTGTHFCTWPGEDGLSVTVNAHVLEAVGQYLVQCPGASPRHTAVTVRLSALLRAHQRPDGSWTDRWHASPFYATAACALALQRFGGVHSATAVQRAVHWVLDAQRPDGSWGRWAGTSEETAYALHILLLCGRTTLRNPRTQPPVAEAAAHDRTEPVAEAVARGTAYLRAAVLDHEVAYPPLWHDKDLYAPTAIVQASILAALRLADTHTGLITGECPTT